MSVVERISNDLLIEGDWCSADDVGTSAVHDWSSPTNSAEAPGVFIEQVQPFEAGQASAKCDRVACIIL